MYSRLQIVKQLVPGLRIVFDTHLQSYPEEWSKLFMTETSARAFEEEVLMPGFAGAAVKAEGAPVQYASSQEGWTSRYTHVTVALAFAITEEAMEDNLYESLSKKGVRWLARAMAHTKEIRGATVINNGFDSNFDGGDGVELFSTAHPLMNGGTLSNELATPADLSETSLENSIIQISKWTDDVGIPINTIAQSLHIPPELQFEAERILKSPYRVNTADNDVNALYQLGLIPQGWYVNHRFTDPDAWFLKTDSDNGLKHFKRAAIKQGTEGDFETGNMRYKARERYSFGWTDWRGMFGSAGSAT